MRFVEGIFCKLDHLLKEIKCILLLNASCNSSTDILLRIAIYEILLLCYQYIHLLMTHGTTHIICPAHRISGKLLKHLHDLLLIHKCKVCRRYNIMESLIIRCDSCYCIFFCFLSMLSCDNTIKILERPWSIAGYQKDEIRKLIRHELLKHLLHSG